MYDAGKLKSLMHHIITDGTKKDIIDALYLLFKEEKQVYEITFESLPYSRGGNYKRHTSLLYSTQSWYIKKYDSGYAINTESTSKSAVCPLVIIPKFYTEAGRAFHNGIIETKINELKKQLL